MADGHKKFQFQFVDPESGADLELRLGLSKSSDGGHKGWEYCCCCAPWNPHKHITPHCPPPPSAVVPMVPPLGGAGSTSIPSDTGGGGSSGSSGSKDSDARSSSRQVINTMVDIREKKMELTESFGRKPCVVTTGDGPHGRTVAGLLTKYDTEEDIRIVCVCHGDCFSPGGFVSHAGGSYVPYPLRKITVLPFH